MVYIFSLCDTESGQTEAVSEKSNEQLKRLPGDDHF